ncbi:hypothetical protein AB685_04730 [Bacillus sp. LL01]|nr:hypothetical protein AB685_04730 [Bacillus sp. LL01]
MKRLLSLAIEWIEAKGTRLRREVEGNGRPRRLAEEAPGPPRGKRVPAAESNGLSIKQNLKRAIKNKTKRCRE